MYSTTTSKTKPSALSPSTPNLSAHHQYPIYFHHHHYHHNFADGQRAHHQRPARLSSRAQLPQLQIMGCPFLVCICSCIFMFRGVALLKGFSFPLGHSSHRYELWGALFLVCLYSCIFMFRGVPFF